MTLAARAWAEVLAWRARDLDAERRLEALLRAQLDAPDDDAARAQHGRLLVDVLLRRAERAASPLEKCLTLLDVSLEDGAELALPIPLRHQAFVLPVMGRAMLNGIEFGLEDLSVPHMPAGPENATYQLKAHAGNTKFAVFIGVPLQQAFFSNGPMAFASQEHLIAATAAYHRGEMGTL